MARQEAEGGKLADQEKWKREEHPFDACRRLKEQARRDEFPKPPDNFRWRCYGLFCVAPNQDAYMRRLRIPNGVVAHWQFEALADAADRYAGGYRHVATRANPQMREIPARCATDLVEAIEDAGLSSRHSGADNIRNVTGDATAGFAPRELIDTRVASSWLAERIMPGASFKAYVQKAHNFALPADGSTPIVMCGPGTGIAPFRAFMHERVASGASGDMWLFFGHQRRAADFFYEEEIEEFQARGALKKLSFAWSRDGEKKTYVQDRMREEADELLAWFERGAHFYICGDARRMAADVERAIVDIFEEGKKIERKEAQAIVAEMKKTGRYQADVY